MRDERRRLEPLRLNESDPPAARQGDRGSSAPGATEEGLEPSWRVTPIGWPAAQPVARPRAGLLAGVFTLGLLAGAGTLGAVMLLWSPGSTEKPPSKAPAPLPRPSTPASAGPREPAESVSWTSLLREATCEAPCSGGAACASANGKRCSSGFTCIPGPADTRLDDDEWWTLHVSAIWERDGSRFRSGCSSDLHRAEVCLRPASTGKWTCVPLADACAHGDHATQGVPITTRDLTSAGIDIEIRSDRGVVASRSRASYRGPMRRSGLCSGFKLGGFTSTLAEVGQLTFFLEPAP